MRPTGDRVRESLFARLGDLAGTRVLDLFAGTGSLGIEALSRGAREAVFVERAPASLACLRANLAELDLGPRSRVLATPVRSGLRRLAREEQAFDLVLLDPPYAAGAAEEVLAALVEAPLLAPAALAVLEASRHHAPEAVVGLTCTEEWRYGDTLLRCYRRYRCAPVEEEQGGPERP